MRREQDLERARVTMSEVREWLQRTGVSQRALSLAASVHPTHLNRWVKGHALPLFENQVRLYDGMAALEQKRK